MRKILFILILIILLCFKSWGREGEKDENFQAAKRFARQQFNRINKMVINGGVE